MCAKEEETFSEWREGMMICFTCKNLWKLEELFLEDEKIAFTLNYSFIACSLFNAEGSMHDSIDGAVRMLWKSVDSRFTFEVDALLDTEGLGEAK